jgi:hypothetical protein
VCARLAGWRVCWAWGLGFGVVVGAAVCDRGLPGLFGEVDVAVGEAQFSGEEKRWVSGCIPKSIPNAASVMVPVVFN